MQRKLLIIGARDALSLGGLMAHHARLANEHTGYWERIATAGIMGEDLHMDITQTGSFNWAQWSDVICTAGINEPSYVGSLGYDKSIENQIGINAIAPLICLNRWYSDWLLSTKPFPTTHDSRSLLAWVMVSSNSAHIARSQSVGYCASKAALSMGVRSFARTIKDDAIFNVWGYELGELQNTPMTREVQERLLPGQPTNRIPRGEMDTERVAKSILLDLQARAFMCHGTMLRIDGGDQ